jgi:hypothetical protein
MENMSIEAAMDQMRFFMFYPFPYLGRGLSADFALGGSFEWLMFPRSVPKMSLALRPLTFSAEIAPGENLTLLIIRFAGKVNTFSRWTGYFLPRPSSLVRKRKIFH